MTIIHGSGDRRYFWCPGCGCAHDIDINKWEYNGNSESPTITPSIRVKHTPPLTDKQIALIKQHALVDIRMIICHSFVTDGRIQFLEDSTHKLAGQTVDLPDWYSIHL